MVELFSLSKSEWKAFKKLSYNWVETDCGSSQKGRVTFVIWQKFSFEMQMEQIKLRSGWKRICSPHPLKNFPFEKVLTYLRVPIVVCYKGIVLKSGYLKKRPYPFNFFVK